MMSNGTAVVAVMRTKSGEQASGASRGSGGSGCGDGESPAARRERLARFFAYWPNMDSLIDGALRSAGLTASVRSLGSLGGAPAATGANV